MNKIYFIGDLSQIDAKILIDNCKNIDNVLEFGVGGSTQIFSMYCSKGARLISIDTEPQWIQKTKNNILLLEKNDFVMNTQPVFVDYKNWQQKVKGNFDVIFNDGISNLREQFGKQSWKLLKIGGKMIVHDTKRPEQINYILNVIKEYWLEIENIDVNSNNSNMTIITKKEKQDYYNWNSKENKQKWEKGRATPPQGLWKEK